MNNVPDGISQSVAVASRSAREEIARAQQEDETTARTPLAGMTALAKSVEETAVRRASLEVARQLERNGCDPAAIEAGGGKRLHHLVQEMISGEVVLEGKTLVRVSAAVLIRVPSCSFIYHEVQRRYPGGNIETGPRPWTVRETLKSKEEPRAAAERGLAEELQFWTRVPFAKPDLLVPIQPLFQSGPSKGYVGLQSRRVIFLFLLDLPALPWPDPVIAHTEECGTRITIERFAASPFDPVLENGDVR